MARIDRPPSAARREARERRLREARERREARDPYLRDPNIARAASFQVVTGLFLGVGLGWAIAGWFGLSIGIGIAVGAVVGFVLANWMISQYGGRSTR